MGAQPEKTDEDIPDHKIYADRSARRIGPTSSSGSRREREVRAASHSLSLHVAGPSSRASAGLLANPMYRKTADPTEHPS